ncbi:hypothetical protein [Streptomyces lavendofoliae]|uniref:hypothetical protein n=1 Tax=Streptomyces lavendofoliae TaxID=67314 RepID=UPI003D8FB323
MARLLDGPSILSSRGKDCESWLGRRWLWWASVQVAGTAGFRADSARDTRITRRCLVEVAYDHQVDELPQTLNGSQEEPSLVELDHRLNVTPVVISDINSAPDNFPWGSW